MYNFIERCLNNSAALRDVDDYVEYWHTHDEIDCSLQEYLGMTAKEYELWVKRGNSVLTDILQGRRERSFAKRPRSERGLTPRRAE